LKNRTRVIDINQQFVPDSGSNNAEDMTVIVMSSVECLGPAIMACDDDCSFVMDPVMQLDSGDAPAEM